MVDKIHKRVYQTRTKEPLESQVLFLLQSPFRINYSEDSYCWSSNKSMLKILLVQTSVGIGNKIFLVPMTLQQQ